jgi:hypothetical protein
VPIAGIPFGLVGIPNCGFCAICAKRANESRCIAIFKESAAVKRRRRGRGATGCDCSSGVIIGGTVKFGLLTEAPGEVAGVAVVGGVGGVGDGGVTRFVLSCATIVEQKSTRNSKVAVI